jgi:hypothetical protein
LFVWRFFSHAPTAGGGWRGFACLICGSSWALLRTDDASFSASVFDAHQQARPLWWSQSGRVCFRVFIADINIIIVVAFFFVVGVAGVDSLDCAKGAASQLWRAGALCARRRTTVLAVLVVRLGVCRIDFGLHEHLSISSFSISLSSFFLSLSLSLSQSQSKAKNAALAYFYEGRKPARELISKQQRTRPTTYFGCDDAARSAIGSQRRTLSQLHDEPALHVLDRRRERARVLSLEYERCVGVGVGVVVFVV